MAAGFSNSGKSLQVAHCEDISGTEIRIISARKATRKERMQLFGV
ncbi:MAG: BrnT family toxin [Bdellovibrionaceae bacterium]|nr:BrnT family toxin [Pseudobdellovibrionaceae bacterium]